MTCYPFWNKTTKRVLNIGTAGGWTKASTGYTFKNSDKKSSQLVAFFSKIGVKEFHTKTKFWFYDLLLLNILDKHNELGARIFSSIFKRDPCISFKFLDEETSYFEDFHIKMPSTSFHQGYS
jgi:lycopene beta-cyclase